MFLVSVYETLTIVFSILFVIVAVACILLVIPIFKGKKANINSKKIISDAEIKAEHIIKNAQLDAKQYVSEMKAEADKDIKERKQEIVASENKLLQREQSIDLRDAQLLKKENNLEQKELLIDQQIEENKKRKENLQTKLDGIIEELQKVSQMSLKEAKEEIMKRVEEKCQRDIALY